MMSMARPETETSYVTKTLVKSQSSALIEYKTKSMN